MNVIEALKKGINLEDLGIQVSRYNNGYLKLNYTIFSPKNNPVVEECRGLVLLERNGEYEVITRPFKRFYNYGEAGTENTFSFSGVEVYEKADGSMVTLSWSPLDNRFVFGTRGMVYAEGPIEGSFVFKSFEEAILNAARLNNEKLRRLEMVFENYKDRTFMFEYIGPENKIVTRYEESQLVLLAVVKNTGEELNVEDYLPVFLEVGMNVRLPVKYKINTLEEILDLVSKFKNLEEGVIVKNKEGNRVKIKSSLYVKAHKMKGNNSKNNLLEIVIDGEDEEFLAYFPETRDEIQHIKSKLYEVLNEAERVMELNSHLINDKREFGVNVSKYGVSSIVFRMARNSLSAKEAFYSMDKTFRFKFLKERL